MNTVACGRCGETKDALEDAPVGGELGGRIVAEICAGCWDEWSENSARLINHYGLVLGNAAHRSQLRAAMKQFLGFEPMPDAHEHHQAHGTGS